LKIFKYYIFIIIFSLLLSVKAQVVFEPIEKDIYPFLIRKNNKGNISFNETVQPISRIEIGKLLVLLEKKDELLSKIEKEELSYFLREFGLESKLQDSVKSVNNELSWVEQDGYSRLRLFHSFSDNFDFVLDPLIGISIEKDGENQKLIRAWGFNAYGYISDNVGFQLNFTDNTENGDLINPAKISTSERGINIRGGQITDQMDYSFLNAGVTYNWVWGYLSLQKNYSLIGSGNESRIILSDKAPSFTKLELDVQFTDWLRLHYFHGFLHSDLMDSTTYINTSVLDRPTYDRRQKYYAFHVFSLTPNSNWTINLGESIIYSDQLEPIYFIPVMFFRLADHFYQRGGSDTGDNAQMFIDVNYKNYSLRTKFYSTLFLDELSFGAISGDENSPASIAYTFGFQTTDFPLDNSLLTVEYSRLNPFIYMNGNDAQTYTSHSYPLGHWIGANGDIFTFKYYYKLYRWADIDIYYSYIRKGEKDTPNAQYELPYPDFLHGLQSTNSNLGITLKISFINALGIQFNYEYQKISNEIINSPTAKVNYFYLGFSVNYGLF